MTKHCPNCGAKLTELEPFNLVALVKGEELGLKTGKIRRFVCSNEEGRDYVRLESGVLIDLYVFRRYLQSIGDWE